MRALAWQGIDTVGVVSVPDPAVQDPQDIVVQVSHSVTCGSDLHLLAGYIPFMQRGDVLGHEFLGEVVEVGPQVQRHSVGDRVVVSSFVSCGRCWYCRHGLFALCDNGNPNPGISDMLWGGTPGGCFGYSHAMGGFSGSHAEYIRVPFADVGAFRVPDDVPSERAVFASDSAATGWMGADLGGVGPGDVVAVWGAGAVGQLAARASMLLGAQRVVVIDRVADRLAAAREHVGCETLDYSDSEVAAELREITGGRGPDVCIEAVGMEAHGHGPLAMMDRARQRLRMQTDRPTAVRQAIHACRKGGTVVILGVFAGIVDAFPLGAVMNKGLTIRSSQMHGQHYVPMLLERMQRGELVTEYLATHVLPLEEGQRGYTMFRDKADGNLRTLFEPGRQVAPAHAA